MRFRIASAYLVISSLVLTGCTATAPTYQAGNANVQILSKDTGRAAVGKFGYGPKGSSLNRLTTRGSSYESPVEKSWAAYLGEALRSELAAANRLDPNSDAVVTGTLLENELDGSGSSIGTSHIAASFVVTRAGRTVYERKLIVDRQWESSFIGAIAIPAAQQNYIATVNELLGKLFADSDFSKAIR